MIELHEWLRSAPFEDRPWLMVGKGPTFARRDEFDLGRFNVFGLNHVVREISVDVAHLADIDVIDACADVLAERCRWLVMPRHPHVDLAASQPLEAYFDRFPVLRRLDAEGRLVWYNLHTAKPVGDSRPIRCRHFGSEVALEILGRMGVERVATLGIDGGRSYSTDFADFSATRLSTGAPNFDVQFFELDRIAEEHGMDVTPLVTPLRVFVGCDESQQVAFRVLAHSIRKHASQPVEIVSLADHPTPLPRDPAKRGRTGFSYRRFLIPQLSNYEGRAVYLDADMQVFADIADLWKIPMADAKVLCTYQPDPPQRWRDHPDFHRGRHFSVLMLDCGRLDWDINRIVADVDAGRYSYDELMADFALVAPDEVAHSIPLEWNSLEHYEPGVTKLVHYTVVSDQPWKNDSNPLVPVWQEAYEEAMRDGAVPPEEVVTGIRAGHLKRSLADALTLAPSSGSPQTDELVAARYHIDVLEGEVERLNSQVAKLQARLRTLQTSPTWRAGRAVVGPIQSVQRMLQHRTSANRR